MQIPRSSKRLDPRVPLQGVPPAGARALVVRWPLRPLAALLLLAVIACSAGMPGLVHGATVPALYEGTVPGELSEAGRAAAAAEALRQVVVRVTGRRGADRDPALQSVYASASRYVQTIRPVGGGLVAVGFDADALNGALMQARQPLWSSERPVTLVLLVLEKPGQPRVLAGGVDAEEKRAVDRAAQLRGVPLAWPGALDATTEAQRIEDVLAGRTDALAEFAARYEAEGVLYGRASAQGVQWGWSIPGGTGSVAGGAAEGVHGLADRYAAALATGQTGAIALLPVVVTGARSPLDFTAAASTLSALPNVLGVQLESATGDRLTFRVTYRGELSTLRRAVAAGGRLLPDESEPGALRFALQP
jgi:uncharacterized protein